jgi:ElaB/YqjD/DUF883 family membrane-anchored ribosome-binding protein
MRCGQMPTTAAVRPTYEWSLGQFDRFTQGAAMDNSDQETLTQGSAQANPAEEGATAAALAKRAAREAIDTGKGYAQNAINEAGKRLTAAKEQVSRAADQGTHYVSEQPARAVAIAAAGGAILGALLVAAMRGRR